MTKSSTKNDIDRRDTARRRGDLHGDSPNKAAARDSSRAPVESSIDAVKPLTPAAQRALKEANERRAARRDSVHAPKEIGGRDGLDPARYGDWEKGGIASDF